MKHKGFDAFYSHMRGALQGDAAALALIFSIPVRHDAEGYESHLLTLYQQLGDDYFAGQLKKQPPETQREIFSAIYNHPGSQSHMRRELSNEEIEEFPRTYRIFQAFFPTVPRTTKDPSADRQFNWETWHLGDY